jgi:hypothetical protein
MGVVRL